MSGAKAFKSAFFLRLIGGQYESYEGNSDGHHIVADIDDDSLNHCVLPTCNDSQLVNHLFFLEVSLSVGLDSMHAAQLNYLKVDGAQTCLSQAPDSNKTFAWRKANLINK